MDISPADMAIQPKRKECLSPLATMSVKVIEHSVEKFSAAKNAGEGWLIGFARLVILSVLLPKTTEIYQVVNLTERHRKRKEGNALLSDQRTQDL